MTVKTIHVGVGRRGTWPVKIMGPDPKFQPTALVDLNKEFLTEAGEKLSLDESKWFDDLEKAIQTVEADAIVICTPTKTHAPLSRIGFKHGKHVLVEKGMTMDWKEANDLVAEAKDADVKFCVAQNYRYFPHIKTITNLLQDESHPHHPGKPEIIDCIHHRYRPEPLTLSYPFAVVWDMGCHHIDFLSGWLGEPKRVTSVSSNPTWSQYEHDANISALIEYESGAICHYVLTHAGVNTDLNVFLQGSKGSLSTGEKPPVHFRPLPERRFRASEPVECELIDDAASEQGVVDDFHRYIAEGVEPGISGRNNLKTLAVCEMMVRSAIEKRPIERSEI